MRVDLVDYETMSTRVGKINASLYEAGYDIKVSASYNPMDFSIKWTASYKGKVFTTFKTYDYEAITGRILQDYYKQGCCYEE